MDIGFLIGVVGGPILILAGARQIWPVFPLLRSGVQATGTVVRLVKTWEKEENVWLYAPVVSFRDAAGAEHQFTTDTSTSWQSHQAGQQVTVRYPPGRPEAAYLKSRQLDVLRFAGPGLGIVFVVAGVFLLWSAIG